MTIPDPTRLSEDVMTIMREVAETIILPRHKQLAKDDIRTKTHAADLVTIADEEAERVLEHHLSDLLPDSLVIGEEAVAANAAVLDRLASDAPVWIIDPIDGTVNFVNGGAAFAVMIALMHRGETLMGWIHDPLQNRTLYAEKGGGAWLTSATPGAATARIHLQHSPDTPLSAMSAAFYSKEFSPIKGKFAHVVRVGSAAHDYWALTDGRLQVSSYRRLKPWDHAAGVLIHTEAGGYDRLMSGEEYRPAQPDQAGLLCAPSQEIWDEVMALMAQAK